VLIEVKAESENENRDLPDALPYIDTEYNDENIKSQVDALVVAEMENSTLSPEDYLQRLGLPEPEFQFLNSTFLATEWKRLLEKKPQTPLDTTRYRVEGPKDRNSVNEWQQAIGNARAQLEHLNTRVANLELLKRYGGNAWKSHNQFLSFMEKGMEMELKKSKEKTMTLNRKRKMDQVKIGEKLRGLEDDFFQSVKKNHDIEIACFQLEQEIQALRERAEAKGVLPRGSREKEEKEEQYRKEELEREKEQEIEKAKELEEREQDLQEHKRKQDARSTLIVEEGEISLGQAEGQEGQGDGDVDIDGEAADIEGQPMDEDQDQPD